MARREFSKRTKREIAVRSGLVCERHRWKPGEVCTRPAKEFDHIKPDALSGEPTLENAAYLCVVCHREKSDKHDVPTIARADLRRDRLVLGIKPNAPKLKSRGFAKRVKREPRPMLPPKELYR
jgi:5-methylcytosine-specific restriction protein A